MKSSRSVAELELEVSELKSQALTLKRTHNEMVQARALAKVRERKLQDELRRAGVGGKERRDHDEYNQALQTELNRVRRRNGALQEQLRKVADSAGRKTPRVLRRKPTRRDENVIEPDQIELMLDRIGEKVANTEKKAMSD